MGREKKRSVKCGCPETAQKVSETIGPHNSSSHPSLRGLSQQEVPVWSMKTSCSSCIALLMLCCCLMSDGGILNGRRKGNDDEAVETLLAVGLIAKALSDTDKGSSTKQCPPPVTKFVHVPFHTERIYVVQDKNKDHDWADSKNMWKGSSNINWR